jgi:pimeloyl-ACP methyl ester carboxylesterase
VRLLCLDGQRRAGLSAASPGASGTALSFESWDGLRIAYRTWGEQSASVPVVLHHGFVADAETNWVATGLVERLLAAGRRVVAPDARGHGRSEKPHDPARYGESRMARDLATLVDVIGAEWIDLVGYSMGAIVALLYAASSSRVRRLAIGGVGAGVIECGGVDRRRVANDLIVTALASEDPIEIERMDPGARAYRRLADAVGADRQALIAQASAIHRDGVVLGRIGAPTLLLAGEEDPLAERPRVLVDALPDGRLRMLDGNHMSALGDPRFGESVVDFLAVQEE